MKAFDCRDCGCTFPENDTCLCPDCGSENVVLLDETFEQIVERLYNEEPWDGFNSDAEADADVLASAGWGTDEDYGFYGDDFY